jgi:hypothetical protein
MKELVFKYFDTFCYSELIKDVKYEGWVKPDVENHLFGYSIKDEYLCYNHYLQDIINSMFEVRVGVFKIYFAEWFKNRYNLPVSSVM